MDGIIKGRHEISNNVHWDFPYDVRPDKGNQYDDNAVGVFDRVDHKNAALIGQIDDP